MHQTIVDLLPVIAADQDTFATTIAERIRSGWQRMGTPKQMRSLDVRQEFVYVQWMVLPGPREANMS